MESRASEKHVKERDCNPNCQSTQNKNDKVKVRGSNQENKKLTVEKREQLLNAIMKNSPVVFWAVDHHGKLLLCEGKGLEALGCDTQNMEGKSLFSCNQNSADFKENFQKSLKGELICSTQQIEKNEETTFENWQGPLYGPDGEIIGVGGVALDVTKRKKAEDGLLAEKQNMERLLDSHERDRKLTAYEIHDGLVQDATGAQMHLETILKTERELSNRARSAIEYCQKLVEKTILEARHLISGLRPPILDELGLVPAIEHLVKNHKEGGKNIVLDADPAIGRLSTFAEGMAYRIAQEAIANAFRHSRSEKVNVSLKTESGQLELEVLDFGVGFDPSNVEEKHFGIQGMRERARLLGSQLEIYSSPGNGTRVFLKMPLAEISKAKGSSNQPE